MEGEALSAMGLHTGGEGAASRRIELSRGRGCVRCRGTGYHGREGVFEVLPFTETMKSITTEHAELSAIQALCPKGGDGHPEGKCASQTARRKDHLSGGPEGDLG